MRGFFEVYACFYDITIDFFNKVCYNESISLFPQNEAWDFVIPMYFKIDLTVLGHRVRVGGSYPVAKATEIIKGGNFNEKVTLHYHHRIL